MTWCVNRHRQFSPQLVAISGSVAFSFTCDVTVSAAGGDEEKGGSKMSQTMLGSEKFSGHYELHDLSTDGGGFRVTYNPSVPQHSTIMVCMYWLPRIRA